MSPFVSPPVQSQSLSAPSHVSRTGPVSPLQRRLPSTHTCVPVAHSPTSLPHTPPPPGLPSSTSPSHSSSSELHSSSPSTVQHVRPETHAPCVCSQGVQAYSHPLSASPSSFQ